MKAALHALVSPQDRGCVIDDLRLMHVRRPIERPFWRAVMRLKDLPAHADGSTHATFEARMEEDGQTTGSDFLVGMLRRADALRALLWGCAAPTRHSFSFVEAPYSAVADTLPWALLPGPQAPTTPLAETIRVILLRERASVEVMRWAAPAPLHIRIETWVRPSGDARPTIEAHAYDDTDEIALPAVVIEHITDAVHAWADMMRLQPSVEMDVGFLYPAPSAHEVMATARRA